MAMRGCPTTGRMFHNFDPATHRCRCGRWQPGHKPKTAAVKERAECQICERRQAVNADGTLGHHGYKRPGWGCIVGDCTGVGHEPYPATSALLIYRALVGAHIAQQNAFLKALPTLPELPHTYLPAGAYNRPRRDRKPVTVMVKRGECFKECERSCGTEFAHLERVARANAENEIAFATRDLERVEARIAAAVAPAEPEAEGARIERHGPRIGHGCPALGPAEAAAVRVGSRVVLDGIIHTVAAIDHRGKQAPYFRFLHHEGSNLGNWYSWEICGKAPRVPLACLGGQTHG